MEKGYLYLRRCGGILKGGGGLVVGLKWFLFLMILSKVEIGKIEVEGCGSGVRNPER